jgi:DNA polymerase-1
VRWYREIWAVDFEFVAGPGDRPAVVCCVARELRSGRTLRLWQDELGPLPPYPTDAGVLFVAYYASAELGCHMALDWPMPERILDLFSEFRCATNGQATPSGASLIGALVYHGLDAISVTEKAEMRDLIMGGGPWSEDQRRDILEYCESDVDALGRLLPAMLPRIDLPRALFRGRYMAAAARMEWTGVPIDMVALDRLRHRWFGIQDRLIAEIDASYGVFEGRTFKIDRFAAFLKREGIEWPVLPSGHLNLDKTAFREAAQRHPRLDPLRELRIALSEMRLNDLAVGGDGRNRTLLSAFRARTSRNQPSSSRFIFGPSVWLRSLIQAPPGHAVAYVDYCQQEFGIAAALSSDAAMMEAYRSGDPYLAFAVQAGACPPDATKHTHGSVRDQFKACVLAVQYGMAAEGLALRIGRPTIVARELLRLHHETYRMFWAWSDQMLDNALLTGRTHTVFGWRLLVPTDPNDRSLRNFPMQANGAEMLRLACCLATERSIQVCAPVHDAALICAPIDRLEADIAAMQDVMREASRIVLDGFELRTDVAVYRHPDRYQDPRGKVMWDRVTALVDQVELSGAPVPHHLISKARHTQLQQSCAFGRAFDGKKWGSGAPLSLSSYLSYL